MNKLSLTKKILATACAVAGLTFVGGSSEAADVDNQKSVLKPQNTLNIINDMNMRNTNPYFESINVVNSENSQVLKQIRNDKVSVIQDNNFSQTNGVFGLNNVSASAEVSPLMRGDERGVQSREGLLSLNQNSTHPYSLPRKGGQLTGAAAPTPTLDDLQSKASTVMPTLSGKYDLATEKGENTRSIVINGTTYYYTPNEDSQDKLNMLDYLAGSSSVPDALIVDTSATTEHYLFKAGGTYYTFDTTKLPVSAYTIKNGSEIDYNYFAFRTNPGDIAKFSVASGTPPSKYVFKVSFSKDKVKYYNTTITPGNADHSGSKITWGDPSTTQTGTWANSYVAGSNVAVGSDAVDGVIRLSILNNDKTYYTYTYDKPSGYVDLIQQERLNNSLSTANVDHQIFAGISTSSSGYGGAIYNTYSLSGKNIISDFIGNMINSSSSSGYGGALYNTGKLGNITGDFIGNSVVASVDNNSAYSYGGALHSNGTLGNIIGDFIGNSVVASVTGNSVSSYSYGGAISSSSSPSSISSIKGDFIGNGTFSTSAKYSTYSYGGAIHSASTIGSIEGDFIGNTAFSKVTGGTGTCNSESFGGALYLKSTSTIGSLVGNFINNYTSANSAQSSANNTSYGGAIYNAGTISSLAGNFIGNAAIANYSSSYAFTATSEGGAIKNIGTIGSITGDFIGNCSKSSSYRNHNGYAYGGAISNSSNIASIVGDFIGNYSFAYADNSYSSSTLSYGGALYNYNNTIDSIVGDFRGNYAQIALGSSTGPRATYGGAIFNQNGKIKSIVGDFSGNYVTAVNKDISSLGGGAIFNGGMSSNSVSYNENSVITLAGNTFTDNYVNKNGLIKPNSIYNAGVINIADGATVTINDGYDGTNNAQLKIGSIADSGAVFNLSVDNGVIQTDYLGTVTNNGTINWDLDVSLTAKNSDKITASFADVEGNNKSIIINAINLITGTGDGKVDITLTTDSTLKTAYTLSDSILSHITKAAGVTYTVNRVDYDPLTGVLTFNGPAPILDSLAIKVHTGDPLVRVYGDPAMTANETVGENLGTLAGGTGAKLTINGGGFAINGGTYTGITVAEGQTLEFNNVSDVTGFADDTAVTNGGTLEISDSTFTSKIVNNATMNLKGTANTLNGAISGANGATTVSTGTTTFGADLTQKDLTIAQGAGVVIDADNLNITNAIKNDGTVTLSDGTLKSSIANNTATTGKTVIDGDVTIQNGKTVSQAMEVTAGTGHKLSANVASIGGAVTNNADLVISSQDPITSETTHFNQNVTGSGTTTIQRNVNVDSTIANNVVIDKYVDGSSNTHYANVVVGSTGSLGTTGKTIEIKAGDGTNYNTLSIGTGSVAADSITNNSKLVLNNSTDGTLSKAINGSGILNISTTGDNADNVVVGVSSTITNQAITVEKGIFQLAAGASLAGSSAVNVASGAGMNSINGAINDYTTGNTITLADGARVYVDITGNGTTAQIDKFIADESSTITLSNLNVLGAGDIPAGEVQLLSDGKVAGESIFIQSGGKTVAVQGTGRADGTVKVGMTPTSDKLNGAVYVSGAVDAITYSMTDGETVNTKESQPALGHVKDSFIITSNDPTDPEKQRTITATAGTKGLIVDSGKSLNLDNVKFEKFATGTVSGSGESYNGDYKGIITNYGTLNVKNSYFAVSGSDGNTAKIAIANYGTLTSDHSVYEGGVMNNKGASFTVSGDTFQNIDRSAYDGGAIYNEAAAGSTPAGTITMNKVTATNNKAANGGVLYNAGTATINGGTFTGNSATALGGAIYTSTNLTINSDSTNGAVSFSGNTHKTATTAVANDIYMAGGTGDPIALNLNAADTTTNTITLGGGVDGSNYDVNVNNGTATGKVTIASLANAGTIALKGGELDLTSDTTVTALTASTATTLNASSTNGLNVGTLTVADGGTFTNSGNLTATTVLTNGHAGTGTTGTIKNDGTLNLTGSNMENVGTITATSSSAPGTLNISGASATAEALLSNIGTINNNNIVINQYATLVTPADQISAASGTITNDGKLDLTGATGDGLAFANSVTGNGKTIISDNIVTLGSSYTISQAIDITRDTTHGLAGILKVASANSIGGAVTNDVANGLVLQGGTLTKSVGTPTTTGGNPLASTQIAGTVVVDSTSAGATGKIAQDINIVSGSLESTNASNISGTAADSKIDISLSDGTQLILDDGTLSYAEVDNAESATTGGKTVIKGANVIVDNTSLIGTNVEINSGKKLTISGAVYDTSTPPEPQYGLLGAVANAGTLDITGGSIVQAISGAGTTNIKGTVSVNDNTAIANAIVIVGTNQLTTNAGNIDGGVTNAAGTLVLNGGTLETAVSGAGTTNVIGAVTNSSTIENAVEITADGSLETATSGLTSTTATTKNAGLLKFNDTDNGTLGQSITTNGTTGGTVEIAAADGKTIDMTGKTITGNTIKLSSGTLKAGSTDGNVNLSGATKIEANGGTLSVQDGKTGTIQLGVVDTATNSKNLNVSIDADFMHEGKVSENDRGILGSADVINATSFTGTKNIHVSDINLIINGTETNKHPVGTEFTAKIANGAAANAIDVTNTTITSYRTDVGNILLSYIVDSAGDGYLTGKHETLNDAITSSVDTKMYFMDGSSYTTVIDGPKTLNGTSLSITTNGNNITSKTAGNDGIVIGNASRTLSITGTNLDPEQPNTTISGFGTAINNTAGGTVNLTNVTMSGNTTDVDNSGDNAGAVNLNGVIADKIINDGEGTNGVFLTGTNSINSIVDKDSSSTHGQTTITNGTATITTLKQKGVTVNAGATANLTDIAQVSTGTSGITNDGDLVIAGGDATTPVTNNNTITKSTSTTGNAKTTIAAGSNITNNADITQKEVVVSSGSGATPAGELTNAATTGVINADTINVNAGATLTNNGAIAGTDGTSASAITVKDGADLDLNAGSSTKADVTLETATSDMTITDTAVLTGNVKTDNGGAINLVADHSDIALSTAISGNITDTAGTGAGSYIITATTANLADNKTVTIDDAIAGATEVNVNNSTNAVITDDAYTSTTAGIKVGNGSDLVLENTTAGQTAVGSAISSNKPTDDYVLTVNNSAGGTTDINNTITGASTVTGDGGVTNFNNTITGATTIAAENGTTNLNAGSKTSTAAQIGNATIQVKSGATAQVTTTSDNFVLTNDVVGAAPTSTLKLSGNAPTDPKSDKNDVGTIFSVNPNNTIGSAVEVASGQLNTGDGQNINGTVTVKGNATLNTMDGTYQSHGNTVFEDNALVKADVSAITGKSDDFTGADEQGTPEYLTDLNITDMNKITGDTKPVDLKKAFGLNNLQATDSLISSLDEKYSDVMTPIRKMKAVIDTSDNNLLLRFTGTGNGYNDFNPAVMVSPIAAQLGGYLSQLNSYDEAFRNLDMKMLMTREERKAFKMANLYASEVQPKVFSPTYLPEKDSAGWFRPYASFEKVNLKGGPNVENVMYGSYFGGDSQMKELRNGWDFQYSVYIGYNGSHQNYQGNSIYQNGGNLGATGIWYKDDFFTALTANVGASVADASTMYGSEDFPMLMTGVASKTGYNWELAKGKFIIQPSWLMSYTFVNTFDYTNAAGVRIKSDPLHAINMAPGVKFIGNLKHGWQPYVSMRMVWNIMDQTDFHANNVSLPELSVKPYFQYGVGLQKRWGDRFTGFAQAMLRSGGRNGIALSAGLRWAIGKDYHSYPDYKPKNKTSNIIKKTTTNNMHDVTTSVESQKVIVKQLDDNGKKMYANTKPVVQLQNSSTNINKQVSSVKPKKVSYKNTTLTSNSAVVTKL